MIKTNKRITAFLVCSLFALMLGLITACTKAESFTVTFFPNNGEASQTVVVRENQTVTPITFTKSEGGVSLTLVGWYENEDLSGEKFDFTKTITKNLNLYAKWENQTPPASESETFKSTYSAVLSLTIETVQISDKDSVNNALTAYEGLSEQSKSELSSQKELLDSLLEKINLEEARLNKLSLIPDITSYQQSDYTSESWSQFISAIESDTNTINEITSISELTSYSISANVNVLITRASVANTFKINYSNVLQLTTSTVQISNKSTVNNALSAYNQLNQEITDLLADEKALLDNLIARITQLEINQVNSKIDDTIKYIPVVEVKRAADTVPVAEFKQDDVQQILSEMSFSQYDIDAVEETFNTFNQLDDDAKSQVQGASNLIKASSQVDYFKMLNYVDSSFNRLTFLVPTIYDPDVEFYSELNNYLIEFLTKYEPHQVHIQEFYDQMMEYFSTISVKLAGLIALQDSQVFIIENESVLALTTVSVQISNKADIENAISDYQLLSHDAKQHLLTQKALLDGLLLQIQMLQLAENQAIADIIISAINNLPNNLQLTDKATVDSVRALYEGLNENVKLLVTNLSNLVSAEGIISGLVEEAQQTEDAAYLFTQNHSAVLSLSASTITLSDKTALQDAVTAYTSLNEKAKSLLSTEKKTLDRLSAKIIDLENKELADTFKLKYSDIFSTSLQDITVEFVEYYASAKSSINEARQEYNELASPVKAYLVNEMALLDALYNKMSDILDAKTEADSFKSTHAYAIGLTKENAQISDKDLVSQAYEASKTLSNYAKEILFNEIDSLFELNYYIGVLEGDEVSEIVIALKELDGFDWYNDYLFQIVATEEEFSQGVELYWQKYQDLSDENKLLVTNFESLFNAKFILDVFNDCYSHYLSIEENDYMYYYLMRTGAEWLADYDDIITAWTDFDNALNQIIAKYASYADSNEVVDYYINGELVIEAQATIDENLKVFRLAKEYYELVKDFPQKMTSENYLTHRISVYTIYKDIFSTLFDQDEMDLKNYAIELLNNQEGDLTRAISSVIEFDSLAGNKVTILVSMCVDVIGNAMNLNFDSFEEDYDEIKQEITKLSTEEMSEFGNYFGQLYSAINTFDRLRVIVSDEDDIINKIIADINRFFSENISIAERIQLGNKIYSNYQTLDSDRILILNISYIWSNFTYNYDRISSFTYNMIRLHDLIYNFGYVIPDRASEAQSVYSLAQTLDENQLNNVLNYSGMHDIYSHIVTISTTNITEGLNEEQLAAYAVIENVFTNLTIGNVDELKYELYNVYSIVESISDYFRYLARTADNMIYECSTYNQILLDIEGIDINTWDFENDNRAPHILYNLGNLKRENNFKNAIKYIGQDNYNKINAILDKAVPYYVDRINQNIEDYRTLPLTDELIVKIVNDYNILNSIYYFIDYDVYDEYRQIIEEIIDIAISELLSVEDIQDPQLILDKFSNFYYTYGSSLIYEILQRIYHQVNEGKGKEVIDDKENPSQGNSKWDMLVSKIIIASEYLLASQDPVFEDICAMYQICVIASNLESSLNDLYFQLDDLYNQHYQHYPNPNWSSEVKDLFNKIKNLVIEEAEIEELEEIVSTVNGLDPSINFLYHSYEIREKFELIKDYLEYLEFVEGEKTTEYQQELDAIYTLINSLWLKNDSLSIDNAMEYYNLYIDLRNEIYVFNQKYENYSFYNEASKYMVNRFNEEGILANRYHNYYQALDFVNTYYVENWVYDENDNNTNSSVGYYYNLEGLNEAMETTDYNKLEEMFLTAQAYYSQLVNNIKVRYNGEEITRQEARNLLSQLYQSCRNYNVESYSEFLDELESAYVNELILNLLSEFNSENAENFLIANIPNNFNEYFPETYARLVNEMPLKLVEVYNKAYSQGNDADLVELYGAIRIGEIISSLIKDDNFSKDLNDAKNFYETKLSNMMHLALIDIDAFIYIEDSQLLTDAIVTWYNNYSIAVEQHDFRNNLSSFYIETFNTYIQSLIESANYLCEQGLVSDYNDVLVIRRLMNDMWHFVYSEEFNKAYYDIDSLYYQLEKLNGDPNWSDAVRAIFIEYRDFGDVSFDKKDEALALYGNLNQLEGYIKDEITSVDSFNTYYNLIKLDDFVKTDLLLDAQVVSFLDEIEPIIKQIDFSTYSNYSAQVTSLYSISLQHSYLAYRYDLFNTAYTNYSGGAYLKSIIGPIVEETWNPVEQFSINETLFYEIGCFTYLYGFVLEEEFNDVYQKAIRIYEANREYLDDLVELISHNYYANFYSLKQALEECVRYNYLVSYYVPDSMHDFRTMYDAVFSNFFNEIANRVNEWSAIEDKEALKTQIVSWHNEYSFVLDLINFNNSFYSYHYSLYQNYLTNFIKVVDYLLEKGSAANPSDVQTVLNMSYGLQSHASLVVGDFYEKHGGLADLSIQLSA